MANIHATTTTTSSTFTDCVLLFGSSCDIPAFRAAVTHLLASQRNAVYALTLLWIDDAPSAPFPRAALRVEARQNLPRAVQTREWLMWAMNEAIVHYPSITSNMWLDEPRAWETWRTRRNER